MREIQAALVGGEACVSFWSALERIRRICGMDVCARPRTSLEDLVPEAIEGGRRSLIAADLPSTVARDGEWARWLDPLRKLSERQPRPTVVLYIPPLPAHRVKALESTGLDQFIVSTEGDYPRAVQQRLTRVLLPKWVHGFTDAIPPLALSLELDLALKGFLLHPESRSPDESLGGGCGRDPEEVRREFGRGGLPPPEDVCAFGLLYAAARKERESEGGGERWLRRNGFHWEEFERWCPSTPGGDLWEYVRRREPRLILKEWGELVRDPRDECEDDPKPDVEDGFAEIRGAIAHLYQEHSEAMVRLGMSLGLSREEAEDQRNDVFLGVVRGRRVKVDQTYLLRAVRRGTAKRFRDSGRRANARAPLDAAYLRESHPDPGSEWLAGVEPRRLDQIIEALPEPGRTVLRMCCVVGWSAAMLAPLLGMTASAVGSVRDRTRRLARRRAEHERSTRIAGDADS